MFISNNIFYWINDWIILSFFQTKNINIPLQYQQKLIKTRQTRIPHCLFLIAAQSYTNKIIKIKNRISKNTLNFKAYFTYILYLLKNDFCNSIHIFMKFHLFKTKENIWNFSLGKIKQKIIYLFTFACVTLCKIFV